ncbi:MAG: hypothetical protein AAB796_02565 [Patescibacteria group bacterium]
METENRNYYIIAAVVLVLIGGIVFARNRSVKERERAEAPEHTTISASTSPDLGLVIPEDIPYRRPSVKPLQSAPQQTKEGDPIVYLTADGFKPFITKVKIGRSAEFINASGKAMQIVINDDQGSQYPEFNQTTPVGKGEKFTFGFIRKGVWGYHNGTSPVDKGIIIVEEAQ